jgi:predicted DNA-binding antitoxin AbrB/MazE fold protein
MVTEMQTIYDVRAVYHDGVLRLLDPVQLPDKAEVRLHVQLLASQEATKAHVPLFVYPTRMVPAEKLDCLTGLVEVGGDALADAVPEDLVSMT